MLSWGAALDSLSDLGDREPSHPELPNQRKGNLSVDVNGRTLAIGVCNERQFKYIAAIEAVSAAAERPPTANISIKNTHQKSEHVPVRPGRQERSVVWYGNPA